MGRQEDQSRSEASGAASPFEGLANHGEDCPYGCPICAGIAIVKGMSPEVTAHLAAAAREFMLAAKVFLDSVAEQDRAGGHNTKVQKIPIE